MKRIILLFALILVSAFSSFAQGLLTSAPANWFNLDAVQDNTRGVSTEKAYFELLKDKKAKKTIIVAVIDSGIDIEHEDLKDKIWVNPKEVAGNGKDDDQNGYIDDINGWNFIGNAQGGMVNQDNLEMTRLYVIGLKKFEGKTEADVAKSDKSEFLQFKEIEQKYKKEYEEAEQIVGNIKGIQDMIVTANETISKHLGKDDFTIEEVNAIESEDGEITQAKGILNFVALQGLTNEALVEALEHFDEKLNYNLNTQFDPRSIVGDNYSNFIEKYYGNNLVEGPDAFHGTHVAGIIGACRNNDLGIKGIANDIKIMVLRTVPNGDERDKDVANSIIYAADNGANIINMSFGKAYSPQKAVVDNAVKYAEKKGVLFVHAAGNDSENNDEIGNFPNRKYLKKKQAQNWIEVGAANWSDAFIADFSNYGAVTVDVFAPGVDIYSSAPGSEYKNASGTSMAAPVVSGIAALVWSYYPEFSAKEIKDIILKSAIPYKTQKINIPGTETEAEFSKLSNTGAIVNVFKALELAEKMKK